jgi:hypothetical protein
MTPGVYLNLPEEDYFKAPALGSTDLVKLCYDACGWWWASGNNPAYERDETPALRFGKMLHAYVLEGEEAFNSRHVTPPFPPEFNKLKKEYQEWKKEQEALELTILDAEQYNSVVHMANLILLHPELGGIRSGLNEVSVFWEDNGILFRARFDSMTPSFSIDFKSLDGEQARGDTLAEKVEYVIDKRHYDIQRAHYETAREKLCDFVSQGLVFGGTQEQMDKIKFVASRKDWAFLWVFFQKIDNKKGKAPVVYPVYSPRADDAHEYGFNKIKTALANYRGYHSQYGLEVPWARIEPIKEMTRYRMSMSYVPQPEFEQGL